MLWSVHLEGGPRRVNQAAVAVGNRIYSFGGYCAGEDYRETRPIDVFVFNTNLLRWKEIAKPDSEDEEYLSWPHQRYGHTVCAFENKIYLFGGRNDDDDNHPCNTLYCFDPATLKWTIPEVKGDVPAPRDGHSACVINSHMYVFSGYESESPHLNPDVYKLDLKSFEWKLVNYFGGTPPLARDFHTATAIGDCMFVFGGRSKGQGGEYYCDRLSIFDTTTQTWITPPKVSKQPRPSGRRSHTAINLNGNLLLFGGYNSSTLEHKNDMWIFDTKSWEWSKIRPLGKGPNPRRRMSLVQVESQVFLFGGTGPQVGLKLHFTPEQIALMLPQGNHGQMIDHNDLFVLDLNPSLRTLCLHAVINNKSKFDVSKLPHDIRHDLENMTREDSISEPFRTLRLG